MTRRHRDSVHIASLISKQNRPYQLTVLRDDRYGFALFKSSVVSYLPSKQGNTRRVFFCLLHTFITKKVKGKLRK